jgi:hypothetical protein
MKNRDVMLGSLKLNLSATRNGVAVSYYDQDYAHNGGMTRVRIGYLSPEELRAGAADAVIDITPILPIAAELFAAAGGSLTEDAA